MSGIDIANNRSNAIVAGGNYNSQFYNYGIGTISITSSSSIQGTATSLFNWASAFFEYQLLHHLIKMDYLALLFWQ